MLDWAPIKHQPQLDIVGIVAILGEGSTTRNAQASALGWHHVLPRLLPAPQALLEHEHKKRLPTVPGTVVGVYSGNVRFELNYFCQLLHEDKLGENEVELVTVERCEERSVGTWYARFKNGLNGRPLTEGHGDPDSTKQETDRHHRQSRADQQAYGVKKFGTLAFLSVLGCCMSLGMIVASIYIHDGPALLATVCLSVTSSTVGFASWWRLKLEEDVQTKLAGPQRERLNTIPDSDVVIFYPRQGAFRIIRCSETISRLYFKTEVCEHVFGDNAYRALAFLASIFLMVGLLSMSNAKFPMQAAFALSYVVLNALYWGFSALNPTGKRGHWKHRYNVESIKVKPPTVRPREVTRQKPLLNQDVAAPAESRKVKTWSSPDAVIKSPIEVSPTEAKLEIDGIDMRQRRVTFPVSEPASRPAGTTGLASDGGPVVRSTSILTGFSTPSRRQTADVEEGRERFYKPFGSVLDVASGWFNGARGDPVPGASNQPHSADIMDPGSSKSVAVTPPDQTLQGPKNSTPTALRKIKTWLSKNRIFNWGESTENDAPANTFTTALWTVIALTGKGQWLHQTHIAPENRVWYKWIEEATKKAQPKMNENGKRVSACSISNGYIQLPIWNYQQRLKELFDEESDIQKRRPPEARTLPDVFLMRHRKTAKLQGISPAIDFKIVRWITRAKTRVEIRRRQNAGAAVPESVQTSMRKGKRFLNGILQNTKQT